MIRDSVSLRICFLFIGLCLLFDVGAVSLARDLGEERRQVLDWIPIPTANATRNEIEIIYFGGDDGSGIAFEGGLWDWDTVVQDPFQGWVDDHDQDLYFGRVSNADFESHGDPVIPAGANPGMIWCGIHEDEAIQPGFPTGMGYQNEMCQWAYSPQFTRALPPDANDIQIQFDYFLDTEDGFDRTYCYLNCFDNAGTLLSALLIVDLTGVSGSPAEMISFQTMVPYSSLPPETDLLQIAFHFNSDGGWSDEDGFYDCYCGPFGADDVSVVMGAQTLVWDFNENACGWSFERCSDTQMVMGVLPEDIWTPWLVEAGLTEWPLSGYVWDFIDELGSPYSPPGVPEESLQSALSGPVPRGDLVADETIIQWDSFLNANQPGTFIRPGFKVFPDPASGPGILRWSERMGQNSWFMMEGLAWSGPLEINLSTLNGMSGQTMPEQWDSMRVVFEVSCVTDLFGIPIINPGDTGGAPLLDNFRVGLVNYDEMAIANEEVLPETDGVSVIEVMVRPNPAIGQATIRYRLVDDSDVILEIFDSLGRLVKQIRSEFQKEGEQCLSWDGRDNTGALAAGGVYLIRLRAESGIEIHKRITVLR